jgi:hypothetical protein
MDIQRAVGLEIRTERYRRERLEPLGTRSHARQPWIVLQVPDDDRLPGDDDTTRQALAQSQVIEVARRPFRQPSMDRKAQLASLFVEEVDAAGFRLDDVQHLLERMVEHLGQARESPDAQGDGTDGCQRVGAHDVRPSAPSPAR